MDRGERISRGLRAQELLENVAFQECMTDLLNEQFVSFLATDPLDEASREKIHSVSYGLTTMQGKLQAWEDDARIEKEKLVREREDGKKRDGGTVW